LGGKDLKLYRVEKIANATGSIIKAKHKLANNDREAMQAAREDEDCPRCNIMRDGKKVGSIT
jgi:hypothetical protein